MKKLQKLPKSAALSVETNSADAQSAEGAVARLAAKVSDEEESPFSNGAAFLPTVMRTDRPVWMPVNLDEDAEVCTLKLPLMEVMNWTSEDLDEMRELVIGLFVENQKFASRIEELGGLEVLRMEADQIDLYERLLITLKSQRDYMPYSGFFASSI